MIEASTIQQLMTDIEGHEATMAEGEERFFEACRSRFEAKGTLDPDLVVELYGLLDKLDDRASYSSSGDWEDDSDDDYDY